MMTRETSEIPPVELQTIDAKRRIANVLVALGALMAADLGTMTEREQHLVLDLYMLATNQQREREISHTGSLNTEPRIASYIGIDE